MKHRFLCKAAAIAMTFFMTVNGIASYVYADETENTGTVYGAEETVKVTSGQSSRETNFNEDWKFYLGTSSTAQNKNFDDSGWDKVTLPHDFSIIQDFTTSGEAESGFLPGGTGWYRKTFTMPEGDANKHVILSFDGVYANAYVYVNGTYVGEHHYGYTNFAFDITEYLTIDGQTENVIAVKAVNNIPSSRWYSGSGIYRDVTLIVTNDVHVDYNGTYVTTPDIANGDGTVNVAVDVVNEGTEAVTATVTNTVYKKDGTTELASASANVEVTANGTTTVSSSPVVPSPELWSIETPNLYTVHTAVIVDGVETDSYDTTFGFRYFSFDSQGFHLNGKNVKLNGVCLHHDQGALGSAAYYDAMYRQLSIMKDMGCNAIRTSHNPADEDFIEICNELGLVVIEEAFDGLVDAKNGNSNDFSVYFEQSLSGDNGIYGGDSSMTWSEYAIKSLVKRDRNAPSVIAWSLGNEIQEGTDWANVSRYDDIYANLIGYIQELDTTRPATSGDNNRGGSSDLVSAINTITNNGGIAGFNYANSASELYSLLQSFGGSTGSIIAAETSSAVNSRSIYTSQSNASDADGKYHLTSYDTSCVGWGITAHDSIYNTYQYDGVAGEFVWTGFDYIGEPTPWNGTGSGSVSRSGAIPNSSYFGMAETTGFEKDTYYLYRSQWNKDETTLHLVTAWDSDNMMTSSSKTPVWVYSNAPVVKLYRDGTLIGTATREEHTSGAGHTYYTYTTESKSSSICSTSSGSGAEGLYAVFHVAYTAGTLSAKAFEADGTTEIALSGNSGKNTVTTPGTVSKLAVSQNKTQIAADGSSLAYITVDVTDANGNLDTTATNTIHFTLEGNGEIVGVDNGDQATTAKFQQSSVLTSSTSANINAYAGKALVIVRSTEDAGTITVNAASDGLTGGSVSIAAAATEDTTEQTGLVSYTMVRDYTVSIGTNPELLTTATGTMADGTTVSGTITWEEITADIYGTAGDYTIKGSLTFEGLESITVTAKLHVIADVIALRNISTVTTPGTVPTLSNVVSGVLADGTLSGEFHVAWEEMTADQFAVVGEIVTVNGTAVIIGDKSLPVTCSVRVVEAVNTESSNVAPQALTLTQDIAASNQSDNLTSIINGTLKPGDNTSERWTNWGNRTTSAEATLTFTWATAQLLNSVNLYYYYDNCCAYPEAIEFAYSLDGVNFQSIEVTEEQTETYSLGAEYSYTFAQVINPIALKITFTQQNGTSGNNCVGLTEVEIMTFAGKVEYNSSAALSQISVDGTAITDFSEGTYEYTAAGTTVTASAENNAGITILPVYNGVVRILTISEDGNEAYTYAVTVEEPCSHEQTEVRDAVEATCAKEGYTGDTYCTSCGEKIADGEKIEKKEHTTVTVNAKDATCTEPGYTGDTYCTVCETTISNGTTIKANGHSYNSVTKDGVTTYTCSVCGDSYEVKELKAPEVSVSAAAATSNKIKLTGTFEDYENIGQYYEVTAHGLVYYQNSRLGSRNLTVNTAGRTKVTFKSYKTDGSFSYTITPASVSTNYTVRAFLQYVDGDGISHYVYSDPIVVNYNKLS